MKKLTIPLMALCLFTSMYTIEAQNAIPASGGNGSGSGGSVSYTVGQLVFTSVSGSGGSVSQGVQQPYEISVLTAIGEAREIDLVYSAFPNPVTDNLTLKIEDYDKRIFVCRLYDMKGKLLEDIKVEGNLTSVPMQNLVAGTYILKITDGISEIKTFKIIKK